MPFQIIRNDITKMKVDAIVNTANPEPIYGPGIDTAVYEAAGGEKLLAKRREIGVIKAGCSAITEGFDLPAKYIIHTVGTPWRGGSNGEEEIIRSCYKSVFKIAAENDIKSLAIPLLASGSYGFPKGIALRVALSETERFLGEHDIDLYLVVFDEESVNLSSELFGDIDEYINNNYVEEKSVEEYDDTPKGRPERPAASASMAFMALGSSAMLSPYSESKPRRSRKRFGAAKKESSGIMEPDGLDTDGSPYFLEESCGSDNAALQTSGDALSARSLDEVISDLDKTFMELVFSFADQKGISDVDVQKKANLDRKAFSKLKCGTTKNPSKNTALAFAIALELNLDETKDLLSRAGFALSPCSKTDVIVKYFIEREAYDIFAVNVALFEHGEQILGSSAS